MHAGTDADAKFGPMTLPAQVDVVRRHIDDALNRGRQGRGRGPATRWAAAFIQPTVLLDVPEDSTAITEETFGPTVTVTKVRDMDEAVRLANGTPYGLGSTVFSKSRGAELARRLRSGMTSVNAVHVVRRRSRRCRSAASATPASAASTGPTGCREFTYAKSVARQRMKPAIALTTFDRTPETDDLVRHDPDRAPRPRDAAHEEAARPLSLNHGG